MVDVQSGLVQNVKTAVINALRKTITEEYPDDLARLSDNISMEYPLTESDYPTIWVQFSFRNLQKAGFAPTFTNNVQTANGQQTVSQYQLWAFDGTVTLNILATTSLMRDKLADAFIKMYSFASINDQANTFYESLANYPYVYLTVDSDQLTAGGQSVDVGTPWQSDQLVYTDSYSFNVVGQFASDNYVMLAYSLDSITYTPEVATTTFQEIVQASQDFNDDGNGRWL